MEHFKGMDSYEVQNKLKRFAEMVKQWNKTINLTSLQSDVWKRHIQDSIQLLTYIDGKRILDVGSGGGFPGMVLAIADPKREWHLVESDTRKAVFLNEVRRKLEINCIIHHKRVEEILDTFDEVIARAFSSLERLIAISFIKLRPNGKGIFMKGKSLHQEILRVEKKWRFSRTIFQNQTHTEGYIIQIKEISQRI
ncbi:MAG: 16S rRNA (guanine(527)-N(7))-methyltransferase RsmG [Holosporales bacterium]|nr:16S rRNA (guanine(527)-N(7))-methyltransferase RsmG [Holosporales bacterium]